ncbi:MAG: HAMP domain-containing histidine kinase [Bacteroidales bacterium]|jgi:signal transduction histidine kinase|nr:HAMP domain-containing histidine kinase [Bacteroidales bacterium]
MKFFHKKQKIINRLLFAVAILIGILSSLGIRAVVEDIANNEQNKVKIWALTVQQKAQVVAHAQSLLEQMELNERDQVQRWAEALSKMYYSYISPTEFAFYSRIVSENTTIPSIVVDGKNRRILNCLNDDGLCEKVTYFNDILFNDYLQQQPIHVEFMDQDWYIYYKLSEAFYQLQEQLEELVNSFVVEVVDNSIFAPVLIVTEDERTVINVGNMLPEEYTDSVMLKKTLAEMRAQNAPIEISVGSDTHLVFYKNSAILTRLQYIPIIFFVVLSAFILSLIWTFRISRRSENDKLWVGMSRETAHQLGTPISSLIGWVEYLKSQNVDESHLVEIEKDIDCLKMISERFSKIGSEPKMTTQNIVKVVYDSVSYLQGRLSKKIKFQVNVSPDTVILANINSQLVEWVFENLSRNAADAIGINDGIIQIDISEQAKTIAIDITDNGKGIPKSQWKTIFEAGYTTKARGWGLGLPLSRRIIHNYHKGEIFVKWSVLGEGTTFRIIFNK